MTNYKKINIMKKNIKGLKNFTVVFLHPEGMREKKYQAKNMEFAKMMFEVDFGGYNENPVKEGDVIRKPTGLKILKIIEEITENTEFTNMSIENWDKLSEYQKEYYPLIPAYAECLQIAIKKFKIPIDEARIRYGMFSINQWIKLLGEDLVKLNPNLNQIKK